MRPAAQQAIPGDMVAATGLGAPIQRGCPPGRLRRTRRGYGRHEEVLSCRENRTRWVAGRM